jgi:hypothetical protein
MQTMFQREAPAFDMLSPLARHRLWTRVNAADGDLAKIADEIRQQLAQLDTQPLPEQKRARGLHQSERAFLIAQLSYLDRLAAAQADATPADHGHAFDGIRKVFRRLRRAQ